MSRVSAHLWVLFFVLLGAGAGEIFLVLKVNPLEASLKYFVSFYILAFASLFSLASLGGYFLRVIFWPQDSLSEFLRISRRQALWFGVMGVLVLFFRANQLFNLWTVLPLLLIFILLEIYLQR